MHKCNNVFFIKSYFYSYSVHHITGKNSPSFSIRACYLNWQGITLYCQSVPTSIQPFHSRAGPHFLQLSPDNNVDSEEFSFVGARASFQQRQLVFISHTYAVRNNAFVTPAGAECCGQQGPPGVSNGSSIISCSCWTAAEVLQISAWMGNATVAESRGQWFFLRRLCLEQ